MSFKYQAPPHYKSTAIISAGRKIPVMNGVVESQDDIFTLLAPLGFERVGVQPKSEPKGASAKA